MSVNQFRRQRSDRDDEPRIGRFVLLSSILHLVLALSFSNIFQRHSPPPERPVYYVDLSQLPVADPRAGRPDGQQETPKPTPREPAPPPKPPAPKPVAQAPTPPPAPRPTPRPEPKPAPKPEPKPAPKPEPKPAPKPEPKPVAKEDPAMSAIERMRQERERAALRERIDQLAGRDSRAGASNAPLGMTDGSGTEAGISRQLWLEERLRQNWSLSRYQVTRRDLVAVVRLTYSADGRLINKRFISPSGDRTFDDSVDRAILQTPQLDFAPGRTWEVPVTFNLKDLMD